MTREFTNSVCKLGSGPACCRFLALEPRGFCCLKLTALRPIIDKRVAAGTFNAKGDNCEGVEP
jgi:hypothetical protein